MTPETTVLATFVLVFMGGLVASVMSYRSLMKIVVARDLFIRQLLDRLATREYAKSDPAIGRIHVADPPSVKEEKVSGPHGRAFNAVAESPSQAEMAEKQLTKRQAVRKTQKIRLDLADEFDRKTK